MAKHTVTFVVDKELDVKNHLIGVDVYKRNKKSGLSKQISQKKEDLLKMSLTKRKKVIEKDITPIYKKRKQLTSLVRDLNNEWLKIEKKFIKKLEQVHKRSFPYTSIRGVVSSADRFGYNTKEKWFATRMFDNKYRAMDVAMHELMHFMFHQYYWETCERGGLSKDRIWDIKEAFTVLLNLEFDEFRFEPDQGYPQHQELRKVIEKSWKKNHDFEMTLSVAIKSYL